MGGVRIRIYGEGEAAWMGTRLIRAGDGGLKDALANAVRRANQGVETELRRSALSRLPSRNGLARNVATARIQVRTAFSDEAGVGVTISAQHEYDIRGLDRGLNVHPLFGNRAHWYPQSVRPGWWSAVIKGQISETRTAIERATKFYLKSHGF